MQTKIIAGDTLKFDAQFDAYPATDGWTLTYKLIPTSGTVISITASANGAAYLVDVLPSTTQNWTPGEYAFEGYVAKGSDRFTVEGGRTSIFADYASAHDTRTHAKKVLDAIEAVIEKRASIDQMQYTINGRELRRTPLADLVMLRSQYKAEVRREAQADRMAAGLPDRRRVYIRTLRA